MAIVSSWVKKIFGFLFTLSGALGLGGLPADIPTWYRCLTRGGYNCLVGPLGWPSPFPSPDARLVWNVMFLLVGLALLFPNTTGRLFRNGHSLHGVFRRKRRFPNVDLQILRTVTSFVNEPLAFQGSVLTMLGVRLTNRTAYPVSLSAEVTMEVKKLGGVERIIFSPDPNPPPAVVTIVRPSMGDLLGSPLNIPAYTTITGYWAFIVGHPLVIRAGGLDGIIPKELHLTDHISSASNQFPIP